MIEQLLSNSRKKNIIILIFMFFVLFGSLLNSYVNYQENKATLYITIDKILKNTALQYNIYFQKIFTTTHSMKILFQKNKIVKI